MTDPEHLRLIPLVEAALALMRLSCEKFFVLVSVYVSYLLFRDPPGEAMRFMIRLNARYASCLRAHSFIYSFVHGPFTTCVHSM